LGRCGAYPDAEPAAGLRERGLLLPVTYSQLVVPREAALGLRGGLVFPSWPEPPAAELLAPLPDGPARAAAAATRGRGLGGGRWPPPRPRASAPGPGRDRRRPRPRPP